MPAFSPATAIPSPLSSPFSTCNPIRELKGNIMKNGAELTPPSFQMKNSYPPTEGTEKKYFLPRTS